MWIEDCWKRFQARDAEGYCASDQSTIEVSLFTCESQHGEQTKKFRCAPLVHLGDKDSRIDLWSSLLCQNCPPKVVYGCEMQISKCASKFRKQTSSSFLFSLCGERADSFAEQLPVRNFVSRWIGRSKIPSLCVIDVNPGASSSSSSFGVLLHVLLCAVEPSNLLSSAIIRSLSLIFWKSILLGISKREKQATEVQDQVLCIHNFAHGCTQNDASCAMNHIHH